MRRRDGPAGRLYDFAGLRRRSQFVPAKRLPHVSICDLSSVIFKTTDFAETLLSG